MQRWSRHSDHTAAVRVHDPTGGDRKPWNKTSLSLPEPQTKSVIHGTNRNQWEKERGRKWHLGGGWWWGWGGWEARNRKGRREKESEKAHFRQDTAAAAAGSYSVSAIVWTPQLLMWVMRHWVALCCVCIRENENKQHSFTRCLTCSPDK